MFTLTLCTGLLKWGREPDPPSLRGQGLKFWAAVHVSLRNKVHLLVFLNSISSPGKGTVASKKKFAGFEIHRRNICLFLSSVYFNRFSVNAYKDGFGKPRVRGNAVSGRIRPTWLHMVIKQKILPKFKTCSKNHKLQLCCAVRKEQEGMLGVVGPGNNSSLVRWNSQVRT